MKHTDKPTNQPTKGNRGQFHIRTQTCDSFYDSQKFYIYLPLAINNFNSKHRTSNSAIEFTAKWASYQQQKEFPYDSIEAVLSKHTHINSFKFIYVCEYNMRLFAYYTQLE